VAILAQLSADFALTYNFQGTHILGASPGHLCDGVIFLFFFWQSLIFRVAATNQQDAVVSQGGPRDAL